MLDCWPCPSSVFLVKGSGPAGLVSSLQKALCSFAYAEAGRGSLWMSRSRKEKKACFLLVRYPYTIGKLEKNAALLSFFFKDYFFTETQQITHKCFAIQEKMYCDFSFKCIPKLYQKRRKSKVAFRSKKTGDFYLSKCSVSPKQRKKSKQDASTSYNPLKGKYYWIINNKVPYWPPIFFTVWVYCIL